ncbi:pentatricopeptide repeat-containing protein At3g14730 isoform X1 [Juglans microcarpa x Juglans regia]|uniref:pentatricopeptide repeat-containing protein At3g14730 isoform X1 n=2 Tax=Juglans microcarpa x Juglans regia TaxID=2249226 RepID=UPI001B7D9DB7|nr:pentatricopeptide repeat-containing protein At3g14730 isoform X1 [Juglans microcarpa x Juglans regia]
MQLTRDIWTWSKLERTIFSRIVMEKISCLFLRFSSSMSTVQLNLFESHHGLATCISSLQSCAHHKNLTRGKQIHSYMLTNGFLNSPLSITSLINMYSKCNRMKDAVLVFNYQSNDHNVFAYNSIISGFVSNGLAENGFEFYKHMRWMGVMPDKFTFPSVIKTCCDVMEVLEVRKIHGLLFKLGLELDMFVGSALVNTYLKFGLMEEAQEVFGEMPVRDVVLWNAMVNGYAQIGRHEEALEIFRTMGKKGVVPSRFTVTGVLSVFASLEEFNNGRAIHGIAMKIGYVSGLAVSNALIDMYGKCKCIGDALDIFEMMDEKDVFSWNSIISVHGQCGDYDGTLRLFDRMLGSGVRPDLVTVTAVLPACSNLVALMRGRQIHGHMIVHGFEKEANNKDTDDVLVNNAVMDMYAKCGSMRDAHSVFNKMSNKDVASWNIMTMGYGMQGYGNEALHLFSCMCEAQIKPDEITFIGLLSACSHAGFVRQGREFLMLMKSTYGVDPTIEHYTCVIDMLGRAGQLEEAYELARTMPVEANSVVWRALLAACRLHDNADLADVVVREIFKLEQGHCGNYVLMSNIYGVIGRYEEVSEIRHAMRQQNVKKAPGCSWIELKNGVHTFITRDLTHPEANLIYVALNSLTARLHDHGYMPAL